MLAAEWYQSYHLFDSLLLEMVKDIQKLNGKRMSCTKFCDDRHKRIDDVFYSTSKGPYPYRWAMFTLDPTSEYEAVPLFVNLYEHEKFELQYTISGSQFHWGKCGESIFLTLDDSDYYYPMQRFCELFYHGRGQIPNEQMQDLPRN